MRAPLVLDVMLDRAPCGFLSFGDDGIIAVVNQTALDLLGYRREELLGRHVETVLTVASRIFYQTHWFPLLRLRGSAEEIYLKLRAKGGEELGVLTNAARRERAGGVAYDCVLMRVAEREKFEDQLLRARQAAEAARAELERQKRELQEANEQLEAQALEMELQQQLLQDQAVELQSATEELRTANRNLAARTEEAERMRAVAEEAYEAKSTFLAVMSHELRTPLNAIAGYVDLLDLGVHGPLNEAQRAALAKVARSERHLLRLINEILNLARIEAGRVEYQCEDVPALELVMEIVPMVEPQLSAQRVELAIDVPPDIAIRADREKTQQILLNLLGNAAKFTPEGGRVSVEAECPELPPEQVCLRVRDTGIGIPPDRLEDIFHPFVQVDASRTRTTDGSGLGLAISRDLARGMGGDLVATSTPGEGSTFTLLLPRTPEPVDAHDS